LSHEEPVSSDALIYLNRLSDLLFVIARVLARHENGSEIFWRKS
jgi:cob(I)alamin adenosyltransferase